MAAASYGALGQGKPAAAVLTDIYTCPLARRATVRVVVCNEGPADDAFSVSLAPMGAPDATSQPIGYQQPIGSRLSLSSVPITCGPQDVVRCRSVNGNCAFTVTGIEKDA